MPDTSVSPISHFCIKFELTLHIAVSHYKNIPVLLLGGFVLMLIACILMATAYPETSYWLRAFPALILIVSGFDIVWNTLSISVVSLVPPHSRSLAGGVFNTAAQFGIAIGLAIDGVIVSAIIGDRQTGPTVYAEAYRAAFWTSVAVIVATGVIVAAFVRGSVGGTGKPHGHEQGKEGKDAKLENKPGSKDLESAIVDSADSVVTDA